MDISQLEFTLETQCDGLAGIAGGGITVDDDARIGLPDFEKTGELLLPFAFIQQNRTGYVFDLIGFGRTRIYPEDGR